MEKMLKRIVWLIIFAPAAYLLVVWKNIPARVALHFGWKGQADKLGSKNELLTTVILMVAVSAVLFLVLTNVYRIDPKKQANENRSRLVRLAFGICLFIDVFTSLIIYSGVNGKLQINVGWLLAAMGLMFAFIGNYMPNIKPNYFAGFRLPWTLESEENWRRTHALVGKLWFWGGLFLAMICIFLPATPAMIIFISVMTVITIIPIVFSYRFYKKEKQYTINKRP
jgi:uncharacterized membrane protein